MTRKIKFFSVVIILSLFISFIQDKPKEEDDLEKAVKSITKDELSTYLKKLCEDFSGRKSAKKGEKITAEYFASVFKKYDLLPAGDNEENKYLQSFEAKSRYAKGTGYNVLGYLEGSDEKLKKECILIGGHIDAVGGSGADDDGSGAVSVLELAEAFSKLKDRPKRSILFAGWGSEEAWMIGSYYYVKNTTNFSLENTKFYINLDMIGRNDKEEKKVTIAGCDSGKPSVEDLIKKHGKDAGLSVVIEDEFLCPPGDNMPFYEKKVPFLYFYTWDYEKLHADYHKKTDSHEKIDFESMEKIVHLTFRIALDIANMDETPSFVKAYKNFRHPMQGRPKKPKKPKEENN